ncbi:MAG: hypothetical protein ACRDBO_00035 [Lachnospiraceae bacterium]
MTKKRGGRRDRSEAAIHDKAVKVRKMTDQQLVDYIHDRVEKARSEGLNQGKRIGYDVGYLAGGKAASEALEPISRVAEFLDQVELPGVGKVTINKLKQAAMEGGFF